MEFILNAIRFLLKKTFVLGNRRFYGSNSIGESAADP